MAFKYNKLRELEKKKTSQFFAEFTPESVANLCFKSVRTVEKWKARGCVPPEYKRVLRLYSKRAISDEPEWNGFYMEGGRLRLPTGQLAQPQQLVLAMALLELGAEPEREISAKLKRVAKVIAELRVATNN